MSVELKPRVTSEEYLALERKAERKSEYFKIRQPLVAFRDKSQGRHN